METYVAVVVGAVIGAYIVFVHFRLLRIEHAIATFPSPEEMAREVIKIKVPINELPQEMQAFAEQMANATGQNKLDPKTKHGLTYIG